MAVVVVFMAAVEVDSTAAAASAAAGTVEDTAAATSEARDLLVRLGPIRGLVTAERFLPVASRLAHDAQ